MHNVEEMMYNQENGNPWHELGNSVQGLATAEQALEKGGLNWEAEVQPLYTNNGGEFEEVEQGKVVVRQSDNKNLGVVGNRYKPLQNKEAFEFFDSIVGEGEAIYETAGSLKGGRVVWLLAKMPDYIRIGQTDDIIEKYVLLTNSHDGSKPVIAKLTPIRVVCNNTLNYALRQRGTKEVRIRHTKNVNSRLMQAKETFGFVNKIYSQLNDIFNGMAKVQLNEEQLDEYYNNVFNGGDEEVSTRTENTIMDVKKLLEEGAGFDDPMMKDTKYTPWGAYQTVTEYVDHHKSYRENTDKLHAITFGSGAKYKEKGFKEALKHLN